jgi:thioredoxin reductase (NADPH)
MADVTTETFRAEVLESLVPVLVDFYANWCGPCRALIPILTELSAEAAGRYKVVKVNTDEQPNLSVEYGVTALPTLLVIKEGKVVAKLVGLQNKARLVEALGIG